MEPDVMNYDCNGPAPPIFHVPPPPRPDFVEFYKCPENGMNDYTNICGALNIIDSGGSFQYNFSNQTSAMLLLCSVLLLIFIFVSSIVIWNHKRKSKAFLSSHKNNHSPADTNNISNMSSIYNRELDDHHRGLRVHQNLEMNNISRPLHYQMPHSPPLFICSSPGPDPYCSNENVYEELEHNEDENFTMNDRQIDTEGNYSADASSLPEAHGILDNKDCLRLSFNRMSSNNSQTVNRNFNPSQSYSGKSSSRFNTEKLNKNSKIRIPLSSFNSKKLTPPIELDDKLEQGCISKGYETNEMMDDDPRSKRMNEFERLIQIRKSGNVKMPSSTLFGDFEMPYHPQKVNSNFYVQSHDMMSNRKNRYRTLDIHGREHERKKVPDYFYKASGNQNNLNNDKYNNNSESDIEHFQPNDILAEFSNFHTFNGQPIYNNSAALSSDSGYSHCDSQNTVSEGNMGNQSKLNSNGNIFILPSVLKHDENSQITDTFEMS